MTPAQLRALRVLDSRAARLTPERVRRYRRAIEDVRDDVELSALERALFSGDEQAAVDAVLSRRARQALERALVHDVSEVLIGAAQTAMRVDVRGQYPEMAVRIGPASRAVMESLDLVSTRYAKPVLDGAAAGVREVIRSGLRDGVNPRVVARQARQFLGLTEYDVQLVQTFELKLRGDPRAALDNRLRDARFDRTLQRAATEGGAIPEAKLATMRDAYAERLLAWRAETYARTTTLNALRDGQRVAWREAADAAEIPPERVVKTWLATQDTRTRPEHAAAHMLTVGIDEPFPVDGGVMTPGDNTWGCRCAMTVRLLARDATRRAAFLNTRRLAGSLAGAA